MPAYTDAIDGMFRDETDREYLNRMRALNAPDPKMTVDEVHARIARIQAWLAEAKELGFAHSGHDGDDGVSDARDELEQLEAKLFVGPRWSPRRRIDKMQEAFMRAVVADMFSSSRMMQALRVGGRADTEPQSDPDEPPAS
jgi:hypothetical protein